MNDGSRGLANRAWLPRATTQFARTVFLELRRAGHDKADILRFINEMVDLLSRDGTRAVEAEPPNLIDPEGGLPDSETLQDILELEVRIRNKDRRHDERLAVVAIDVLVPDWASGAVRREAHEIFVETMRQNLRARDSFGQLGPDRYLLVLPATKAAVRGSIRERLVTAGARGRATSSFQLALRWAILGAGGPDAASAREALEHCFAVAPETIEIVASATAPAQASPQPAPRGHDVVLALGGGAARAVSHAGVLDVLLAGGLRPRAVTGTSAGAIVGAMYACGLRPSEIAARFETFTGSKIYAEMRRGYATYLRDSSGTQGKTRTRYFGASSLAFYSDRTLSILSADHLAAFVEHFIDTDRDIASLPVPCSVVATDLVEGRPTRIAHGSLHAALAASCAVPGLFPPFRIGDRLLIDGGNVTEVPIWTAHLFGLSVPVIAVHMDRPFHRIADYRTSSEVSARSNALVHTELVREQLSHADILLSVPMADIGWLDFRQTPKIVAIGRRAAEDELPRILEQLARPS